MSTGVTAPLGFRAAAVASGIKPDRLDLALLVADAACTAAGVFTANLAQAAPVLVSREHLASGRARAIVVNAGCANAGTGEGGLRDARETAEIVAHTIGCTVEEVLVASTGVIGVRLPMEKVRAGIAEAGRRISRHAGADAARAIMTTDTKPKEVAVEFPVGDATCVVGGMAKGAGMIAPNLATMLAFFTTDAAVCRPRSCAARSSTRSARASTGSPWTATPRRTTARSSWRAGRAPPPPSTARAPSSTPSAAR